jgi:hypothetical protein
MKSEKTYEPGVSKGKDYSVHLMCVNPPISAPIHCYACLKAECWREGLKSVRSSRDRISVRASLLTIKSLLVQSRLSPFCN